LLILISHKSNLFFINLLNDSVTDNWKGLVHALSGLLCGSLNFLDTTTQSTYASGVVSGLGSDPTFRYGTLSHETVCTENLTPFKKLLPSRAKVCKKFYRLTLLPSVD
jgi:phosphatidylinositol glycan class T